MLMTILVILWMVIVCALIGQLFTRIRKKQPKVLDTPVSETSFEDTLKAMSFPDLLGILAIGNSIYVESDNQDAFEQLCMADSELMYRFTEDLLTTDQRRMVDMYFSSPETIMDKVKFSFVQS